MLPDPPRLACPFGPRFNLHRMLYWAPVETPAKNPDQASGPQGSRDCTMAASLYSNQSLLD